LTALMTSAAAEIDGDVVVAVPVHESFGLGGDVDVEDADGFVFEGEVGGEARR